MPAARWVPVMALLALVAAAFIIGLKVWDGLEQRRVNPSLALGFCLATAIRIFPSAFYNALLLK